MFPPLPKRKDAESRPAQRDARRAPTLGRSRDNRSRSNDKKSERHQDGTDTYDATRPERKPSTRSDTWLAPPKTLDTGASNISSNVLTVDREAAARHASPDQTQPPAAKRHRSQRIQERACFISHIEVAVIDVASIRSRSVERTSACADASSPGRVDGDGPA